MKHTLIKLSALSASLLVAFPSLAEDEPKSFTMDGEFGFIFTSGNTETTSFNAGLTAKQELEKWSNDFVLEGLYKRENGRRCRWQ